MLNLESISKYFDAALQWGSSVRFWVTPEDLIQWIPKEHQSGFAWFVATLLLLKIYLLAALFFYVSYRRLHRLWSRRNNLARERMLRSLISNFILNREAPIAVSQSNRKFLRRLVLTELERATDTTAEALTDLYRRLDFLDEDIRELRSKSWPRRLAALIRIEVTRAKEMAPHLLAHIQDENDLVAIAAMRALSALDFEGDIEPILDSLARRAPARLDIFVEILTNIGRTHSEKILNYLDHCYDPFIATVCISVLSDLKSSNAIGPLKLLLKSSNDDVVAASARALGRLHDKEAIPGLRLLLESENPKVRVEAMIALIALGDRDFAMNLKSVQADPSPIVQRALFERGGGS